uniref:Uncharacterized protein n=1 Tax=Coccolithus braarudii TaxID=221442 RepID=A0A7S0PZH5_9EUKA|mmetsp:Transcript_25662/g.55485  ORF Transcript_25662/g.55485 Transcript_25662/m.55485 type:complete len:176 (+) Transcript_25662:3-530(+)
MVDGAGAGDRSVQSVLERLRAQEKSALPGERAQIVVRKAELKAMLRAGTAELPLTSTQAASQQVLDLLQTVGDGAKSIPGFPNLTYRLPSDITGDDAALFAGTFGFSSASGFCCGVMLKSMSRAITMTAGLGFMALTAVERAGWEPASARPAPRDPSRIVTALLHLPSKDAPQVH